MAKTIAFDLNEVLRDFLGKFAQQYKIFINKDFDVDNMDASDPDLFNDFHFEDHDAFTQFMYEDNTYELFGRAEPMSKQLPYLFSNWLSSVAREMEDRDGNPDPLNVMIYAPFETVNAVSASLYFLHKIGCRVREYFFPTVSSDIWDRCDILVTARPLLLDSKPEGKTTVKICAPYNKESKGDYEFESLLDFIGGGKAKMAEILQEKKDEE